MRKAGIVLSAFALAVTLGACGGNDNGGSSTKTTGGNEPAAAMNLVDLAKSLGEKTEKASTAHMKLTADAAGVSMNGEGDLKFGASDAAISMDLTTSEGSISMILLDSVLYMKLPQELTPGKPWIKIDSSSNSAMAKALGSMNEQLSKSVDPRATLQQFQKAGEITDSNEEEIDGKKVTHYKINVDVQKMVDQQTDPTAKAEMQKAIDAGMKNMPVEVWIDKEGLPARFAIEMASPNGSGGTAKVKMQADYTDWGKPVDIAAPPADQIGELPA
ncbi:hypothetical protein [Actinophytocola sp.]|uniref:hypothetical protein n=1 Tax=Actinophytocola sp. TaxID=1872138 RepID=UPI00389AA7E7